MKPGDLVRLYEPNHGGEYFTVGNVNRDLSGWAVPQGTVALVTKVIPDRGDGVTCYILVDGKMGWVYEEDCEVIDETG